MTAREANHHLGQCEHREFPRIPDINRTLEFGTGIHHSDDGLYQIVHVAKATRLCAIAINRDVASADRLDDEIAHDPAIIGMHAWTIGVEYADHLDVDTVLAVIIEKRVIVETSG